MSSGLPSDLRRSRCFARTARFRVAVLIALCTLPGTTRAQASEPAPSRTRVIMLGTGNPGADPDRFGPATAIVVDGTVYLVDCGAGVVRRWAAAARADTTLPRPWALRRLFVTHLHSDHTLGYADLILSTWTLDPGPRAPLVVFGPSGTRAMTEHLLAAYAEDIQVRTGHDGELAGAPPPAVDVHEIAPGVVFRDSRVTVTAFAVHHGTFAQAFGFRFRTPDRDIVISGDAAPPSAIPVQCRRCDILVHEGGFFHREGTSAYRRAFHTSMEDLAAVARASHPKLLVLYHQPPGDNEVGLRYLREHYDGRVVVAKDLDVFR
jgi:ribonuclease Z